MIVTCSHYDRDQRLDFVGVNTILKTIKLVKQKKIARAQSVPNVSFSPEISGLHIGSSIYEDENYPLSPHNHDHIYENYDDSLDSPGYLNTGIIANKSNRKLSDVPNINYSKWSFFFKLSLIVNFDLRCFILINLFKIVNYFSKF